MRKKIKRIILPILFSFAFLSVLTSCGNESKYLDGDACGQASVEGNNAFSQMRRVYCEQFVYEYNLALVAQDKEFAAYADVYSQKFLIQDDHLQLIEVGNDDYIKAHYIFTYYEGTNKNLVENYVNDNVVEPANYLKLVGFCANGTRDDILEGNEEQYGYFNKIKNLDYDKDGIDINKDNKIDIVSVKDRMTAHSKACIVFTDNFIDPATGVAIEKTTYKAAWDQGFLFGLFVYPMAWLIDLFVVWFGSTGWSQVFAIIVVTIILKALIALLTFKSQASTQKMQDIQPELLELQSKYGPTPTAEEKQRMSMEMMALYQKYGVKPFAPFMSLLITFPVFIAMYRAVMYLGILRTGNIGGVILGNILSSYIIGGNFKITALIIFILMAASQILTMKLPQLLNRKRMSAEAKRQQKQTNMMSTVFIVMILVMGFTMPVTMSVYWIASAVVSAIQSILMHKLNNASKNGRYKVKKAQSESIKIPQGYRK